MSYDYQDKSYKVVVCTPAGRTKYLNILKNYILRDMEKGLVDEWHLWKNTDNIEDLKTIEKLGKLKNVIIDESLNSGKMDRWNRQWNLGYFYKFCIDPNTVYIRIDDDVCWMDKDAIEKIVKFRLDYQGFFIVHGNVLNNTINNYIQQRLGNIGTNYGVVSYETWDKISLETPPFVRDLHIKLVKDIHNNDMEKYKYNLWMLFDHEHYSIMVSSWLGDTFAEFDGKFNETYNGDHLVGIDDEQEININGPVKRGTFNAICGQALFIHHAYFYQERNTCMNDDQFNELFSLKSYKEISDNLD